MTEMVGGPQDMRLARDAVTNMSAMVLTSVVGLGVTPIILRGVGANSFGAWISALSLAELAAFLTFGLGRLVAREVAAAKAQERPAGEFLRAAFLAHLLAGGAGCLLVIAGGRLILAVLPGSRTGAEMQLYLLAGLVFVSDQILCLAVEIMTGWRQFARIGAFSTLAAALRAAGTLAALGLSFGVTGIAFVHLCSSVAAAAVAFRRVRANVAPFAGLRPWSALEPLRGQGDLWAGSQLTTLLSRATWQSAPVLLGPLSGTSAVALYYVALRFPMLALSLLWRAAEVVYPAAAASEPGDQERNKRPALFEGTRMLAVFAFPLCTLIAVLAPNLLTAWLRTVPAGTVDVLRVTLLTTLFDALAASSINVLWAGGQMGRLSAITAGGMAVNLGVTPLLLPRLGILGAALALLLAVAPCSVAFVCSASHACGVPAGTLLRRALSGLALPVAGGCGAAALVSGPLPPGWVSTAAAFSSGALTFALLFVLIGCWPEERAYLWRIAAHVQRGSTQR